MQGHKAAGWDWVGGWVGEWGGAQGVRPRHSAGPARPRAGGPLPGGSTDLVLGVLGLVLRNGTLELPKGACVSVAAADVRLEELRFRGEGQEGEKILGDGYANVAGLVVAEGVGCSMALHR